MMNCPFCGSPTYMDLDDNGALVARCTCCDYGHENAPEANPDAAQLNEEDEENVDDT